MRFHRVFKLMSLCGLAGAMGTVQAAVPRSTFIQDDLDTGLAAALPLSRGASAEVGLVTTSYFYSPSAAHPTAIHSLLATGQALLPISSLLTFEGAGTLMLSRTPSVQPYFELPQLNVGTRPRAGARFQVGRVLEDWSALDREWELGIWQPRFRWDYLHPDIVGLTGFFASYEAPGLRWTLYGSPLFIPERGVPISVENGEMSSPSVWFLPPSTRINLFDQETPIQYKIAIPPLRQILLNPGGGTRLRAGGTQGAWASAAYAYKPMNQLLLEHEAFLSLVRPILVPVTLTPHVVYHQVAALDAGFVAPVTSFSLSAMHERPDPQPVPARTTRQTAAPATTIASKVSASLGPRHRHLADLELGYLRRWGGNSPDAGIDANGRSVFEARYPFRNAIRLGAKSSLSSLFRGEVAKLVAGTRVTYDIDEDGAIWSTDVRYRPAPAWTFSLGGDFLATEVLSRSRPSSSSFISRYQVNNRLHAGVRYAF